MLFDWLITPHFWPVTAKLTEEPQGTSQLSCSAKATDAAVAAGSRQEAGAQVPEGGSGLSRLSVPHPHLGNLGQGLQGVLPAVPSTEVGCLVDLPVDKEHQADGKLESRWCRMAPG